MKDISILQILPFFHFGVGRMVADLSLQLHRQGIPVALMTGAPNGNMGTDPALVSEITRAEIPVIILDCFSRSLRNIIKGSSLIRKYIHQNEVSLIHTHTGISTLMAIIATMNIDVPVVSTSHGWGPQKTSWQKKIDRFALNRCHQLVCVSQQTKKEMIREGLAPSIQKVIYNGINGTSRTVFERRDQLRSGIGIGPSETVIGTIAQLIERKGIGHLLNAFDQVHQQHPRTRLLIIGDGPLYTSLREEAQKTSANGAVSFLGYRDDARSWLSALDIFCLPSEADALPMVILEAMSTGKPIAATRVGGIPELITEGESGLLVEPRDHQALAGSLVSLLQNSELSEKLGKAAQRRVEEHFSVDKMVKSYLSLYNVLMTSKKLRVAVENELKE